MTMERREKSSLVNEVFSWSINNILNKDNNEEIKTIPDRFSSVDEYLNSFVPLILEETRTELFSSLKSFSKAPIFYIRSIESRTMDSSIRRSSTNFNISLKSVAQGNYKPKCGDLIALTEAATPRLNSLILAYLFSVKEDELQFSVRSSKSRSIDEKLSFLSGVFLMNLTTNTRILKALHNRGANLSLIKSVLQANTAVHNKK